jgi:plasmid stability protein
VHPVESGITRRKISIYLNDPELRRRLKVAAAQRDISVSAFCEAAIRAELQKGEQVDAALEAARKAAGRLDEKRARIGRLDVETWELVKVGRRR